MGVRHCPNWFSRSIVLNAVKLGVLSASAISATADFLTLGLADLSWRTPTTVVEGLQRVRLSGADDAYVFALTQTSTDIPWKASVIPTKLPATGITSRMSRPIAMGIRLAEPTLRFVGSKVIQPAPGT